MRPLQFISSVLAAPGTGGAIKLIVTSIGADNEPYSGIVLDDLGKRVGSLDSFRFNFVQDAAGSVDVKVSTEALAQLAYVPKLSNISLFGEQVQITSDEIVVAGRLRGLQGSSREAEIQIKTSARNIHIQFHAHGWSGICEIYLNDKLLPLQTDLFNLETALPRTVIVEISDRSIENVISIRPSEVINKESAGRQILIEKIFENNGETELAAYKKITSVNHGADFHERFFEILKELPLDAVVVDVGGGKRQIDDPRYINLEYSPYEEPDILGDGTRLPFKTGSIDMIYTAAVLEHVRDPLAMGCEIFRVLKPGGRLLANSAFMQPVHSEGQHFFNATPYGIREIFSMFPEGNVWWDGSFSHLVKWMFEVSGASSNVPKADALEFFRLASSFDDCVSYDRLMYIASGVWFESIKPRIGVENFHDGSS